MGVLEQQSRKRTRNRKLRTIILQSVAAAGLLSVALLAPNIAGALNKFGLLPKKSHHSDVYRSRKRLIEKGMLVYDGRFLRLTDKGKGELRKLELKNYKLPVPKKWDKKWRILVFDIKEEKKVLRDKVRSTLVALGMERLQDSVWVYPYDCEDVITLLKADFKVGKDLLYIIADSIEYDYPIRKIFNLSSKNK